MTHRLIFNSIKLLTRLKIVFFIVSFTLGKTKFGWLSCYWVDIRVISIKVIHWKILFFFDLNLSSHITSMSFTNRRCNLISSWPWLLTCRYIFLLNFHSKWVSSFWRLFQISWRIIGAWWNIFLLFIGTLILVFTDYFWSIKLSS